MSQGLYLKQTDTAWRCVDGRKGVAIIRQKPDGTWYVAFRGPEAERQLGPQVLGAALGFVAAAETIGGLEKEQAFTVVEEALAQSGYAPQYHVDDHHSPEVDLASLSDHELITFILGLNKGCGFAQFHYGDQADEYISTARERGWSIQLLTGRHAEKAASKNFGSGTTFDTSAAVNEASGQERFNQDMTSIQVVLQAMEKRMSKPGFADKALAWFDQTYEVVVETLTQGHVSASQIQQIS